MLATRMAAREPVPTIKTAVMTGQVWEMVSPAHGKITLPMAATGPRGTAVGDVELKEAGVEDSVAGMVVAGRRADAAKVGVVVPVTPAADADKLDGRTLPVAASIQNHPDRMEREPEVLTSGSWH